MMKMDYRKKDWITTLVFCQKIKEQLYKTLLVLIVSGLSLSGYAQIAPEYYYVQFKDKNNTPFSINQPAAFLSQRAIDRRQSQSIQVTERDLPVDPAYITSVRNSGNITVQYALKWMNGVVIHTTDTAALESIKALSFVDTANSVFILPPSSGKRNQQPIDKFEDLKVIEQSISSSVDEYGESRGQNEQIFIHTLHDMGYRGNGIRIAVLDAGFRSVDTMSVFQDLHQEGRMVAARDFVLAKDTIDYDYSNHGTYVLGTISPDIQNVLIGTAPEAEIVLIRTEDTSTEYLIEEYNWAAGAEFADSVGVDICNTSLGYTRFDDERQDHRYTDLDGNTTVITRAANMAAETGMLIINSAGNSGNNEWRFIGAPADGDLVLAVGAVDSLGNYAGFSSIGPSASGAVKPNVMAMGAGPATFALNSDVIRVGGTSFSSPIIAGAAACLWQANPSRTALEVKEAIEKSSSQYNMPDEYYGYGIPNFGVADWVTTSIDNVNSTAQENAFYPNPAIGTIQLANNFSGYVEIVDLKGQLVLTQEGKTQVDISQLNSGIYLITVGSQKQKLVIQR